MTTFVPWDVRHIDLSAPRDSWRLTTSNGRGAFVVFWLADVPLGSCWFAPEELPLSPDGVAEAAARFVTDAVGYWLLGNPFAPRYPSSNEFNASKKGVAPPQALATINAPLASLREFLQLDGHTSGSHPTLAVVICTRDRPDSLTRCLHSLAQSLEPADEIVVVDNAPQNDATRQVVAGFPGVQYVAEPVAGLSRARNTGIRAAHGSIIAFTDDDVEVHAHWTARVRRAFADGTHAAMTGLVLPASLELESEYLFEAKFGGFSQGFRPMTYDEEFVQSTIAWGVPVWRMGAGANMAFRREALQAVGGFDERLGAGRAGCSEDSELWYRLLRKGLTCTYDPRAVAFHRHRGELNALRKQMRAYSRGHVAALLAQFEQTGDWGNLKRITFTLPRYFAGRVTGRLTNVGVTTRSTYFDEIAGSLAGIAYWVRHRRSPGAPAISQGET